MGRGVPFTCCIARLPCHVWVPLQLCPVGHMLLSKPGSCGLHCLSRCWHSGVQTVGFTHVGMAPEAYSSRFLPHQKIGYLVFLNLFPEDNKYQLLQIIVGAK